MGGHVVLGALVVDVQQGAALHGAADGHGGDARPGNAAAQGVPRGFQHDLVALHQHPVELAQVRQVVDAVFAVVLGALGVLAEAVKHAQLHILVLGHVLLQAVQRGLHQGVVPVHGEERDSVIPHAIASQIM